MSFQKLQFANFVFDRIEERQKQNKNGCYFLKVRALSKKYNFQFRGNIKSAKLQVQDLPDLAMKNFAMYIQNLHVSLPMQYTLNTDSIERIQSTDSSEQMHDNMYLKDLPYIQQKYFENLKNVKFMVEETSTEPVTIEDSFEIDGVNFECNKKIQICFKGPHNITIKNSKFKRIGFMCEQNYDVQILNTKFLQGEQFCVSNCNSLLMENICIISGRCVVSDCKNTCIIKNIIVQNGSINIQNCQNFQISDVYVSSDQAHGIRFYNSSGKLKDCSIYRQNMKCVGVWVNQTQLYFNNLKFENKQLRERNLWIGGGSRFIPYD